MHSTVEITPAESRAIGRAVGQIVRVLVHAGYGWTVVGVVGLVCAGLAAWTAPTWWDWVRDWWER